MRPVKPKAHDRPDWFDVFFVRLRDGFRDHLRHFSTKPVALIVYVWALLNRDHSTGEFVADRNAIMQSTGLSDRQIRDALTWLRHGRRCSCEKCVDLPASITVRPAYLAEVRPAFRSSPPILRVIRDDSEFLAAAKAAAAARRRGPNPAQAELDFGDKSGDSRGATREGAAKGDRKVPRLTAPSGRNSFACMVSVAQDLRSQIEEDRRGAP